MYVIVGTYRGQTEDIDESESLPDAKFMLGEYRLAYGSEWSLRVITRRVKKDKAIPVVDNTKALLQQAHENIANSAKRKQVKFGI